LWCSSATVLAGETALARQGTGAQTDSASTASTSNGQRRITGANHEAPAATATTTTRTADGNLQNFTCSQGKVAADLSPEAAWTHG
jgi:hypothetical protein